MFLTKKLWLIEYLINIRTQPIVLLLGFASYISVYCLKITTNLRKRQVLIENLLSRKKAILSDQETRELFLCSGQI